jgi:hypothetical protein
METRVMPNFSISSATSGLKQKPIGRGFLMMTYLNPSYGFEVRLTSCRL